MITPEYCLLMARYNRRQNAGLFKSLESMTDADLREDRGAFFGSIFRTVNHLLWGDTLWISRFDGGEGPAQTDLTKTDTTDGAKTLAEWSMERFRTDARYVTWAKRITHLDLTGDLTCFQARSRAISASHARYVSLRCSIIKPIIVAKCMRCSAPQVRLCTRLIFPLCQPPCNRSSPLWL